MAWVTCAFGDSEEPRTAPWGRGGGPNRSGRRGSHRGRGWSPAGPCGHPPTAIRPHAFRRALRRRALRPPWRGDPAAKLPGGRSPLSPQSGRVDPRNSGVWTTRGRSPRVRGDPGSSHRGAEVDPRPRGVQDRRSHHRRYVGRSPTSRGVQGAAGAVAGRSPRLGVHTHETPGQ